MEQKQEKDQSKNICRPITFINDYMPIRGKNNDKPEFCAFGIVDGIEVGNAFALDDAGAGITDRIWEVKEVAFILAEKGKCYFSL